jgi:protein-cysteine N-palmitoyltransferase HHAT
MSWLQFIKNLYTPETLDTRFVIPSSVPPRQALEERDNEAYKPAPRKDAQPRLWLTPEFYFYYVMFILIFPRMVKSPMDVSKCKH